MRPSGFNDLPDTTSTDERPEPVGDRSDIDAGKHPPVKTLLWSAETVAKVTETSVPTVRRWDAAGKMPRPVRIGGLVRWRAEEVRAWIEAGLPDRKTWEARRACRNV